MTDDLIFDLLNEQKVLRVERHAINKKLEKTPMLDDAVRFYKDYGQTPEHVRLANRLKEIERRLLEIKESLRIHNLLK